MSRTLHALLVGIDRYPDPIPKLSGCLNDVDELQELLVHRSSRGDWNPPRILKLRDDQAVRVAVLAGFTQHLGLAGRDDVALFYFCGHGSQEPAPEEFWHIEPDRRDETILCYDSRLPGQWDLADKELGLLIRDLADAAGHVVVILDCCHSGSGTRGENDTVRRAPMDTRIRPISSFLTGVLHSAQATTPRGLGAGAGWYSVAKGRHVLLAACRDDQTAKELTVAGRRRGAFSHFLTDSLKTMGGASSYRDLFARTASLVRSHVAAQDPQIEVVEGEDLGSRFLDGTVQPARSYFIVDYSPARATLQAGAVHGISRPTNDSATILALFPGAAGAEDLQDLERAVGLAKVTDVQNATSWLDVTWNPNKGVDSNSTGTFKALVVGLPTPRLVLRLDGEASAVAAARAALKTAGPRADDSLYVREAADPLELAELRLLAQNGKYLITWADNDRPLTEPILADSGDSAGLAIRRLEHIARWKSALQLENLSSGLGADAVRLKIYRDGRPLEGSEIRLEYAPKDGNWLQPEIQIKLENQSRKILYCALLGLSEDFEISAEFFPTGSQRLKPGEEVFAYEDQAIPLSVPDALWDQGIIQVRDILKLIVCTDDFDARLIAQPPIAQPLPNPAALSAAEDGAGTRRGAIRRNSILNRLLGQVQTRAFDLGKAKDLGDWRTYEVSFLTVRPRDSIGVPGADRATVLGPGVMLEGHDALAGATARLSSITASSRDIGNLALPPLLADDPSVSRPFTLVTATTRGDDPGLSVLELDDVAYPTAVTREAPLCLRVDRALGEDEHVIPVAFDGEFFLPLGWAERGPGEITRIVLERLPSPPPVDLPEPLAQKRSLFGSIRICFQKVLGPRLGFDYSYPVLASVSFDAEGAPILEADSERVRRLVAGAGRILLYIHGIIGETRTMVSSAHLARVTSGDRASSLAEHYDAILSFDYEKINTPIQETARDLKARLAAVGLGPDHGKTLHVVAHSMGGLVSRWFIEREEGDRVVQHLVMLGTPNAGWPWPRLQDWATLTLGLGLNGLTTLAWPAKALGDLALAIEAVDKTLDQMVPGSALLKDLAASPDPKVPYTLIAGNSSLPPAALRPQAEQGNTSVLQRFFGRLNLNHQLQLVANQIFLVENDIAVSIASMSALGPARTPPLRVVPVACDHMSYFRDSVGLEALVEALCG